MKKQPKFEVDLIDFKRKQIWMNRVEKTTYPDSILKCVMVGFVIVALIALINIWS